jgi:hypothetical protein
MRAINGNIILIATIGMPLAASIGHWLHLCGKSSHHLRHRLVCSIASLILYSVCQTPANLHNERGYHEDGEGDVVRMLRGGMCG